MPCSNPRHGRLSTPFTGKGTMFPCNQPSPTKLQKGTPGDILKKIKQLQPARLCQPLVSTGEKKILKQIFFLDIHLIWYIFVYIVKGQFALSC
jgi:hypothetical protein